MTQDADDISGASLRPAAADRVGDDIVRGHAGGLAVSGVRLEGYCLTFYVRVAIRRGAGSRAGAALALAAVRPNSKAGRHQCRAVEARRWRTAGVLRKSCANPMYVALTMLVGGIAVALAWASDRMLVLIGTDVLPCCINGARSGARERYLERKFGDDYRRYKR